VSIKPASGVPIKISQNISAYYVSGTLEATSGMKNFEKWSIPNP
jgi:hypothetical protein